MKTDRELLEHDLCPRLPYGLKVITSYGTIFELAFHSSMGGGIEKREILSVLEGGYLPIYRPTSDLTKEITHKGETFVPMDRILNMVNEKYNSTPQYSFTCENLKYYGSEGFIFTRGQYDDYERVALNVNGSIWETPFFLVEKMIEWEFNVNNLPDHLWVDVNTLETNPYA